VTSLTSDDIERMRDIAAGKTATSHRKEGRGGIARGGSVVAGRTVAMLTMIPEFARRKKLITSNPARDVRRLPEGRQFRFLDFDEIRAFGRALDDERGRSPVAVAAIRFLLLSGLRRMEALALPRAWVDRQYQCIRFEDTKSGPQIRPLGSAAMLLLDSLRFPEESPWVFPAKQRDRHFVGLPKVLNRVCARVGLVGVTIHVLRHSYASTAAQLGFSQFTIAGLLGHSVPGVTARYAISRTAPSYLQPIRYLKSSPRPSTAPAEGRATASPCSMDGEGVWSDRPSKVLILSRTTSGMAGASGEGRHPLLMHSCATVDSPVGSQRASRWCPYADGRLES
jgi:integrase